MDSEMLKELGRDIKLVITDMDGTLLNSKKQISAKTGETLKSLKNSDISFTICTGRIPTMIDYYIKSLEIEIPVVAANGAIVWDPKRETPLYEKAIEADTAEELMDFCRFHRLDYSILTLGSSYFSKNSIRIQRFLDYNEIAGASGAKQMRLEYIENGHEFLRNKKIYKMLIYEIEPGQQKKAGDFMEKLSGITYTSSDDKLWDISAEGVNKGSGLLEVMTYLGLKKNNVCAFGDYYNDIPLLEAAGMPIAMGNGCDQIKETSVYITKTNDEDGVADIIERFLI